MSVKIISKKDNEKLFWQYWQELSSTRKAGPKYFQNELEIWLTISKDKKLLVNDESFIYLLNNKPEAGVFLPIEKNSEYKTISAGGYYAIAPMINDSSIEKKIFQTIDDIAKKNKVDKIMLALDPLENNSYNYLQKYNFLDTSILTYVINLDVKSDLLKSCRRGHKCDIKDILKDKNFQVFFIDKNNADYKIHEDYRKLHHKCAGRVTRPKETFDMQFEKLKQGKSVLFGLKYKDKNIAFTYFDYENEKSVYVSASDDPDYDNLKLYHVLIFSAMKHLQNQGIKGIETGQPSSPSQQFDYYIDDKQRNIALFKRGFGGEFKNYFRGIKYFSKTAFKQDVSELTKNFEINRYE